MAKTKEAAKRKAAALKLKLKRAAELAEEIKQAHEQAVQDAIDLEASLAEEGEQDFELSADEVRADPAPAPEPEPPAKKSWWARLFT
jgi:hypothetical protein